ncbi:hypothetical protein GDO78_004202 [Eleutherodactylus coqui]|uniref:Amine oxidase n=1 Tax=Eleutherodactylus coqui TaxID=57060 RepID=A0A8J6EQ83_ELECQ|nr:hypothetical protein GDO78_004202 [Eleutherodactylus coqui]
MNVKVVTALLILAATTILALDSVHLFGSKTKSCNSGKQKTSDLKHDDQSLVFADLTPDELAQVVDYLKNSINENLVNISTADPSSNCIYSVELLPPRKQDALLYLDKGGPKPRREAMAVVYFGSHSEPEIKEYVVGPLPNPKYKKDVTFQKYKGKLPYHRRPVIDSEYHQIQKHFHLKEFPKAKSFLKEVLGYNESDSEYFAAVTNAPRGFASGHRKTWFGLFFNVQGSGFFLHPTGLELLMNHEDLDYNKWTVEKVFYNGEYFESLSELQEKYKKGQLKVVKMQKSHLQDIASLKPPKSSVSDIPMQYEPQGARYSVRNNQVVFQHWSFAFGVNVNRGLRLYDIKFKGERVVYELSIQETITVYGSNAPSGMSTRYMDGHFGIGRFSFQLVRGIDCPYFATFVDTHYLLDSDSSVLNKGSICIFELNSGIPLRRHFSSLGSSYYGGLASTVLIIRTIAAIGNYDYVFDFMFYQNGAIESKVHATGYISTSFFMDGGLQHGHRVGPHTLGTIHSHFINYKVDLDVGGINNSLVALDMEFEDLSTPWNPDWKLEQTKLTKKVLESENQAAFQQHDPMPRYMQFASKQKNKWNHERSYRIQMDLVAWITTGFLHIPHAEDIPNTVTAGNGVGFYLRPYNFFNEDPSIFSEDAVYFQADEDLTSCSVNPLACLSRTASCAPKPPPFTYNGFDNEYIKV